MLQQFLVVETIDARGQLANVYINVDDDLTGVQNGFQRLAEDGTKATGAYSFVESIDGVVAKRYEPKNPPLWADGFRTRAAFLR